MTVLDRILEAPAAERARVFHQQVGDDRALRREVEALLAYETDADHFLKTPILADLCQVGSLAPGTRLGAYEILEPIGQGGMGEVYRARRVEDYEAEVAIKLLHPGGKVADTSQRFHRERQILAELEHPSIARLLDGGTVGSRPYLVMEYVDGEPIDAYCDRHDLGLQQRLMIFRQVCAAVAFAHRNLIVHRDLKPGNILVNSDGIAKLLDFGIAKLLGDAASETSMTAPGVAPMTPRYASPEQILGQPITTATDVYALGLLLFEILTGDLPGRLRTSTPAEIARIICEEETARPSSELRRRSTPQAMDDAHRRRLIRRLRGDLDTIVMKALRKEPSERYASAEALSDDLQRHLEGLPVRARQGNRLYTAGKFIRQHRVGLLVTGLVLLAALGFALRESRRFEFEQRRSQQLEQVLEQLILTADPDTGSLTPAKLLTQAEQQIEHLGIEPRLRGELLDSLGWMHRKLGNAEQARDLAARSLKAWRLEHPGDDPDLALRLNNFAALQLENAKYSEAEALFREALAMRLRLGDHESEDVTTNRANLAAVLLYRGAWSEAESHLQQALETRKRTLGPDHAKVASSLRSLGALHHAHGDFESAEPLLREALDLRRRIFGDDHTAVASVLDLLARVRFARGDPFEAESLLHLAIDIRRRRLGPGHRLVAWSELNLGHVLLASGELETARVLIVRAYSDLLATEPVGHWRLARAASVLGGLFLAEGETEKALPCIEDSYDELRQARGEDATYTREAQVQVEALRAVQLNEAQIIRSK